MRERPPIIAVTDKAVSQVQALLKARDKPAAGIRIGIRTKGCNGMSYALEYADERPPFDEEVNVKGVTLFIDPKAIMFLVGTVMDYKEDKLETGFIFQNPNEKGRCGCGESFHV